MSIDPSRMTSKDAARLLSAAGGESIDVAAIDHDVAEGAPTNDDGTINLVHYTAWLARQVARQKQ